MSVPGSVSEMAARWLYLLKGINEGRLEWARSPNGGMAFHVPIIELYEDGKKLDDTILLDKETVVTAVVLGQTFSPWWREQGFTEEEVRLIEEAHPRTPEELQRWGLHETD